MTQRLVMCALAAMLASAGACGGKSSAPVGAGGGVGSATPITNGPAAPEVVAAAPTTCDGLRPKLDQLYRADAMTAEPKRVDERTADNVGMVVRECANSPATIVACVNGAATIKDIETQCLAAIDDEGTEGDKLAGSATGSGK